VPFTVLFLDRPHYRLGNACSSFQRGYVFVQ